MRTSQVLRCACAVCVLACFGVAAYELSRSEETTGGQSVFILSQDLDIGPHSVGPQTVTYTIENRASRVRRVVGFEGYCGTRACFSSKPLEQPLEIPPHGSVRVELEVEIRRPGEFTCPGYFLLDDAGIREIKVTVRGTATKADTDEKLP